MPESRILVVEDEQDLRQTMADTLEACGYEVVQAENGKAALELLRAGAAPDAILLDLMMPVMNGWEMLAALRAAEPSVASIPVVVVTALSSQAPAGVRRVVKKPFTLEELLARVREALGRSQQGRA